MNEGYKRGFESSACCGGDSGYPYIMYELNDDNSRKMAISIAKKLVDSDLDCKIYWNDDFYTTEDKYVEMREYLIRKFPKDFSEESYSPTRTITRLCVYAKNENSEEVFANIANYIKEAELDKVKLPKSKEEIPIKLREFFYREMDKSYIPRIDPAKPMAKQGLKRKTIAIIVGLNINYWCKDPEKKKELLEIYSNNERIYQKELQEKYNPDNIFKNNKEEIVVENINLPAEIKKENFLSKLFSFIKNLFKR